jgi:adiponectin receptor
MLEESLELKFPSNRPRLGTFADAPKYMQDNEYVVKGYRIDYGVAEIFKSLLNFHNETINIWSHLVGTLIFVFLIIYVAVFVSQRITDLTDILVGTITTTYSYASTTLSRFITASNPNSVEVITDLPKCIFIYAGPLYVHIGSAIFCLMCSSTFHLFHCYNEKLFNLLSRFDYSGIAILICGSTYPPIIYGFACTPCNCVISLERFLFYHRFKHVPCHTSIHTTAWI